MYCYAPHPPRTKEINNFNTHIFFIAFSIQINDATDDVSILRMSTNLMRDVEIVSTGTYL